MWIADRWKDYEVIDTSNGEKLERWGDYILVRPIHRLFGIRRIKSRVGSKRTDIIIAAIVAAVNGSSLISRRHGRSLWRLVFICSHFSLSTRDFFRSRQ